jgi:acetoin utilization deacetylase AcuC-like enzyme
MVSIYQHPFYPYSGDQNPAPNMVNVPVPAYTRGMDIREMIEMMWIPRLEAFKPEMIFISAGFDGHREDDMGQLGMVEPTTPGSPTASRTSPGATPRAALCRAWRAVT